MVAEFQSLLKAIGSEWNRLVPNSFTKIRVS